jgi:hypothetical protein
MKIQTQNELTKLWGSTDCLMNRFNYIASMGEAFRNDSSSTEMTTTQWKILSASAVGSRVKMIVPLNRAHGS